MEKKLPRVFANPIDKEIKNNCDVFYSTQKNAENRSALVKENVIQKINEIFASVHHVYKSKVHIKTNYEEFDAVIVGKTSRDLLTLTGEKININSILTINRI